MTLKQALLCLFCSVCFIPQCFAFGITADQMYRDMLLSERKEKNASFGMPEEEPALSFKKSEVTKEDIQKERAKQKVAFNPKQDWEEIVVAVKQGQVSPFDLAEIRRLSERQNPEAIELLAWMYAIGVGLKQDLQKSYTYYMQAAQMGVPTAYENVRAVYKAMNSAQRASLPNF